VGQGRCRKSSDGGGYGVCRFFSTTENKQTDKTLLFFLRHFFPLSLPPLHSTSFTHTYLPKGKKKTKKKLCFSVCLLCILHGFRIRAYVAQISVLSILHAFLCCVIYVGISASLMQPIWAFLPFVHFNHLGISTIWAFL
jgi:hypothetical protein